MTTNVIAVVFQKPDGSFDTKAGTRNHYLNAMTGVAKDSLVLVEKLDKTFAVGKVVEIDVLDNKPKRHIVDLIDTAAYTARIEAQAQKERLLKDMKNRMAALDEMEQLEMYATRNPAFAALLNQFNSITV